MPFKLAPSGQVSTTSDPTVIANDRMESLTGTFPGERIMLPDYGVDLPSFLFAPDSDTQAELVILRIQQAVSQWEPSLTVNSVQETVNPDTGTMNVSVQFSQTSDASLTPVQTITITTTGDAVNA
jgi:phage baseplate assembly protein W